MNRRRTLLIAGTWSALALPFASLAQQPARTIARIAYLSSNRPEGDRGLNLVIAGLRDYGYVVGKNVTLHIRHAEVRFERLPTLAAELVSLNPDVIMVVGTPATDAARKATSSIPIVMLDVGDPVASGFVKSLRQPGHNVTGTTNINPDLVRKNLELALQVAPGVPRVGVVFNPSNPTHRSTISELAPEASRFKVDLVPAPVRNAEEIDSAFALMAARAARIVIIRLDTLFMLHARKFAELALKNGMLTVAQREKFVQEGCVLSYGAHDEELFRRGGYYVDRIFKGAKPNDLPVEQPSKFVLHVNLKTAKALGVTIPQSVLLQASQVIE